MTELMFVLVARIPAAGVADFQRYEETVLPLLPEYGARIERRLRSADGTREVHLLTFPSTGSLDGFVADPRRAAAVALLTRSGAETELIPVGDVPA